MRTVAVPIRFDRWLSEPGGVLRGVVHGELFTPAMDLHEHDDRYEVLVDLPGVEQSKVDVAFTDGTLRIRGERSLPEVAEGRVLRAERRSGTFSRGVVFREEVDVEQIEATFKDGVLRVRVPKSERCRPRQIPVTVD